MSENSNISNLKSIKNTSIEKYNNTTEIENIIDKIIIKNKDKLLKINGNNDLNFNNFSLNNKKGNTLFYIKKRFNKKQDATEIKNDRFIAKSQTGLLNNIFTYKNYQNIISLPKKIREKLSFIEKIRIYFRFWNRKKKVYNKKIIINNNEDLFSANKSDRVIEEIDEILKIDVNKENTVESRQIEGNISRTLNKQKINYFEPNPVKSKINKKINDDIIFEDVQSSSKILKEKNTNLKTEIPSKKLTAKEMKNKYGDAITFLDEIEEITDKDLKLADEKIHLHTQKDELILFDEDAKFNGWSSHQLEEEKKDLQLKTEIKDESQLGEIKDFELPKEVHNIKSLKLEELGFLEKKWEELDFYPLYEPFAYVEILREKETLEKSYFLVEVDLNEKENQTINFINDTINTLTIDTDELDNIGNDNYLIKKIDQIIKEYDLKINEESLSKIFYYLAKSSIGLGKIDPIMKDPNIEDIFCDGSGIPLFLYHRKFGSLKSNIKFNTEDELSLFVYKLAHKCGKHISIAEPMLDATMPDGSRIQMTLSDKINTRSSTFTIRKFRSDPFSPPDLIEFNTMNAEILAYMWLAVESGVNMLFAGGTASGKTTTLNAISLFIPPESKIVSIEETREINLPHPNWIPGVSRLGFGEIIADKMVGEIDMYDLMKAALLQRPEYILVGEIRGREAYVLFQAMATGHTTFSTIHADSAQSLIHRLEGKPIEIPREMLQSLDVVSLHVITKVKNKVVRRCKQIIEIIDIDPKTKEILTNEIFRWDPIEDKFVYSGKSYILERIRAEKDISKEAMTYKLKKRKKLIELMNKNNIRDFKNVARIISRYMDDSDQVINELDKEYEK